MFLQIIHVGPNDLALICAKPLRLPSFHGCHCPLQGDTPTSLVIKNTGDVPLDGEKLFRRFYHGMDGKKDSTGLGLAIARSIALSSSLKLTYEWQDGMHTFRLVKESKIYR